ncbi:zf-HC2 domain-containing protein, partial [Streptomyces sp. 15-116A]|uniref:anti-sigma factor family protein n=1 Tax=Streptomyces sp. 15-116A TaxID=2259035 RepID=UPI0021B37C48
MSGSRPKSSEGHLAEQHLGDRLSALVDGELGHDARERVLAHVATCAKCKAEVDAQRRLKSVFAQAAPPPPSESLLARLQGLPGGGDLDGGGSPLGGGLPGGASGVFGAKRGDRFEFAYAPARRHAPAPALGPSPDRGF